MIFSCRKSTETHSEYGKELNLWIPEKSQEKLDQFIARGLEQQLLTKEEKEYVPAGMVVHSDTIPIELRLKGDLTDHIANEKVSYRIKLPDTLQFYGSSTFSIQHPKTREYVNELFMHRVLQHEGLIATTFEFCRVTINGEYKGAYAFEGHFDDAILKAYDQLPGPILKFDESNYWSWKNDPQFQVPMFDHARILPFGKSSILKNKERMMQFRMAANLLEYYRNYHPDLSQVFDLDKTARYWALMDFGNVKHARLYRNHRYYYNPITTKMEMIGFDLHAGADPNENTYAEDVFGKGAKPRGYFLEYHLFNNEEFRERYLFYLKKYSSEEFLSQLEELFLPEMKLAEELIQQEEPDYVFDFDYFRQHATTIRNRLDEINTKWNQYRKEEADSARMISPTEYEKISDDRFIPEISVNAYTYFSEGNIWLQAENFHLAEVRVLGYSLKDDPGMYPLKTDFVLPAYEENNHPVLETKVKFTPEKIFIQPLNDTSQIVEVEVQQWVHPYMSHPRLKLLAEFDTVSKWYDIVGDELVLHGEGGPIDELLYIPAKYEVRIPDSTIIQFQDGGGLIINNDFTAQSGPEHPIIFEDLDGSSNGVTILGPGTVILENVNCINLSPLNFGGWKTNTPFTVFESSCYLGGNFNVSGESADLSVMFIRSEIHPRLLRLSEKSKKLIGGFDVEVKYKRQ